MANGKPLELIHPGEILSEDFMKPMGISMRKLARDIGVSHARVSSIVNGKGAITADSALALAKYFGVFPSSGSGFRLTMIRALRGAWFVPKSTRQCTFRLREGIQLEELCTGIDRHA